MAQDTASALEWLKANPNDPRAASVRTQLQAKGVKIDAGSPSERPLYPGAKLEEAQTQAWVFDPLEGAGQMAEHLPGIGPIIRGALPDVVRQWLENYKKEATAGPAQREMRDTAAPTSPFFFMLPEFGGTPFLRALLPGTVGATLQPEDKFSWKKKALEAGTGALTAGTMAHIGGQATAREDARIQNEAREKAFAAATQAHEQAKAQAATSNAAAKAASVRPAPDFTPFVRSWYDYILLGVPGAKSPTAVTATSLGEIRKIIGDRLNKINSQFSFTPSPDFMIGLQKLQKNVSSGFLRTASNSVWNRELNRRLFDPINRMALGRGALSGSDFADFVTNLDARADEIARSARSGGPDDADLNDIAEGLRKAARMVEGAAKSTDPSLLAARKSARESYYRWSVANDSSPPERGGVFKPSDVIKSWSSRVGDARYSDPRSWDAAKQYLEAQRQALEGQQPPVKTPKVTVGPPPTKPPEVPIPPLSPLERVASAAAKGAGYAGLYELGKAVGHPYSIPIAGAPLWHQFAPDLAKLAQQAARLGEGMPGVAGAAAGQAVGALDEGE